MSARVVVIGGGPAGLMAAERLSARGFVVDVFDAMPSLGRKFLMAGKSGLNITHAEPEADFLARYRCRDKRLLEMVRRFGAAQVMAWVEGLGIAAKTGPTGRVFPHMMKASPLLRAWLTRLQAQGVKLHPRHRWTGWNSDGELVFDTPDGLRAIAADASVFALGGGSWKRLGSDGAWVGRFAERGVELSPFAPSNCGFLVDWSTRIQQDFAGAPVKSVRLSVESGGQMHTTRGEFVITTRGVESGGIYTLSAPLREAAASGKATLLLDLLPDVTADAVLARLKRPRGKQSLSSFLRKAVRLSGVKLALLYEVANRDALATPETLARLIKALPIGVTGPVPRDEAISTVGGVAWRGLTDGLMQRALPGVFCAGEMLDWDAPTGGYLITACLATGAAAGDGAADFLSN